MKENFTIWYVRIYDRFLGHYCLSSDDVEPAIEENCADHNGFCRQRWTHRGGIEERS